MTICQANSGRSTSKMKQKGSKTAEIKQHLVQGIKFHQFKDKLPSENILAQKFGVSRMTARKVLSELESEGLVERIQGKGTYIKKRDLSLAYFTIQSSKNHAERLNVTHSCKVLELKMLPYPPTKIKKCLQYDRQTVFVRRLHFFDDKPVRYEVRYLRGDMCGGIFWDKLEEASIHELLISKYDLPLTKVWQRITAEVVSRQLSEILDVEIGHPAFRIERITYTFENPVTSVEYIILGEVAFEDTLEPHADLSDKQKNS